MSALQPSPFASFSPFHETKTAMLVRPCGSRLSSSRNAPKLDIAQQICRHLRNHVTPPPTNCSAKSSYFHTTASIRCFLHLPLHHRTIIPNGAQHTTTSYSPHWTVHISFVICTKGKALISQFHLIMIIYSGHCCSNPIPFLLRHCYMTNVLLLPFITTVWTPLILAVIIDATLNVYNDRYSLRSVKH